MEECRVADDHMNNRHAEVQAITTNQKETYCSVVTSSLEAAVKVPWLNMNSEVEAPPCGHKQREERETVGSDRLYGSFYTSTSTHEEVKSSRT